MVSHACPNAGWVDDEQFEILESGVLAEEHLEAELSGSWSRRF